jgi:glutaredoxin
VKEFLSRAGHSFIVRDVDEDLSAYQELVARGWRTVPVTVVGDTAIKGFDEAALTRALEGASKS